MAEQARINQFLIYPILLRSCYCNTHTYEVLLHSTKKKNPVPHQNQHMAIVHGLMWEIHLISSLALDSLLSKIEISALDSSRKGNIGFQALPIVMCCILKNLNSNLIFYFVLFINKHIDYI